MPDWTADDIARAIEVDPVRNAIGVAVVADVRPAVAINVGVRAIRDIHEVGDAVVVAIRLARIRHAIAVGVGDK